MKSLMPFPKARFFDASGNPLSGGLLYTYAAGTTTPQDTYTDSTGAAKNTNPVVLDANGEADIWVLASGYKVILKDSLGVTQWTVDNISNVEVSLSDPLSINNGDALIAMKQPFSGAASRTAHDKFIEIISVKDFGAMGDGITDDTTAFLAAFGASSGVYVPPGIYIVSPCVFTKNVDVVGSGRDVTTIRWKASSPETSLFTFTGASPLRVSFSDITIDGNKSNQTDSVGYYGAVLMDSDGGSSLSLRGMRFTNGRIQDVVIRNPTSTPSYFYMSGCEFDNGLEGTNLRSASYVQAQENVVCTWIGNKASMPSGGTVGRAGFLLQRPSPGTDTPAGRVVAHANHFQDVGRGGTATDTLGCIDVYSGADLVSIQGNTSSGSMGRFICVKADCGDIVISGNTCIGHEGTVAAIVFFDQAATYSATSICKNLIMAHNIIRGSLHPTGAKGIQTGGTDVNTVAKFRNILITGNIVDGASQYGIYCYNGINLSLIGNKITSGGRGVFVESTTGIVEIKTNSFKDLTNSGAVLSGLGVAPSDAIIQGNTFDTVTSVAVGLFSAVNSFVVKGNISRSCTTFLQTVGATAQSAVIDNDIAGETSPWAKSGSYGLLDYRGNITSSALPYASRGLTIASGSVTVFADYHLVDTEGAAATDDLSTINGGYDGRGVTLLSADNARDITVKDGVGNLQLAGDFALSHTNDTISLICRGGVWFEKSRSDNNA